MATRHIIAPAWAGELARAPSGPLAFKRGPGALVYRASAAPEGWPPPGDIELETGDSGSWALVLMSRAAFLAAYTDAVWHTAAGDQRPGTWQWWEQGEWQSWAWLGSLHPGSVSPPARGGAGWTLAWSARYAYGREYYEPSGSAYFLQNLPGWARARCEAQLDPGSSPGGVGFSFGAEYGTDPLTGKASLTFTDLGTGETAALPRDGWRDGASVTLNEMTARILACGDN